MITIYAGPFFERFAALWVFHFVRLLFDKKK
jgi:hypothetical protein